MKNILIIRASSGIGAALASQLKNDGTSIHTACRRPTEFNHQTFDANSPSTLHLPESLDGLVYCPGSINLKPFHRLTAEEMTEEFQLNALGAATVIQQALPALKKQTPHRSFYFPQSQFRQAYPYTLLSPWQKVPSKA